MSPDEKDFHADDLAVLQRLSLQLELDRLPEQDVEVLSSLPALQGELGDLVRAAGEVGAARALVVQLAEATEADLHRDGRPFEVAHVIADQMEEAGGDVVELRRRFTLLAAGVASTLGLAMHAAYGVGLADGETGRQDGILPMGPLLYSLLLTDVVPDA